jgi:hypothetical protein
MFVDTSGSLGIEHARDMRRTGRAHRLARIAGAGTSHHAVRAFAARGQLSRSYNYRTR